MMDDEQTLHSINCNLVNELIRMVESLKSRIIIFLDNNVDDYSCELDEIGKNLVKFEYELNRKVLSGDTQINKIVQSKLQETKTDLETLKNIVDGEIQLDRISTLKNFMNRINRETYQLGKVLIDLINSSTWIRAVYEEGFQNSLERIQGVLNEIDVTRETILEKKTKTIYSEARKINQKQFEENQKRFFWAIGITLVFSITLFLIYKMHWLNMSFLDYLLIKVIFLLAGITLITYFLRNVSIFRKKADQAEQTHLELTAFPSYVIGMNPNELSTLKKDLAMKYFGKELEQTQNDKIGDLIQDQLKNSVELIKASAEVVKGLKAINIKNEKVKQNESDE
ncbi:hypothetical protein [Acinetobacter sp. YH1901134]|uniref:hypothetical protein n=1 Tax=Acinetobacter sp. YH1901134 TaxID=2601199 RepID=UPI0015D2255B|nr:hypothetical protein [Acinetobacter sp. YH1901134]